MSSADFRTIRTPEKNPNPFLIPGSSPDFTCRRPPCFCDRKLSWKQHRKKNVSHNGVNIKNIFGFMCVYLRRWCPAQRGAATSSTWMSEGRGEFHRVRLLLLMLSSAANQNLCFWKVQWIKLELMVKSHLWPVHVCSHWAQIIVFADIYVPGSSRSFVRLESKICKFPH